MSGSGRPSIAMAIRTKTCPDCAETVNAEAKVCRFCGYRFDQARERPRRVRTFRLPQPEVASSE
jgi:predicted amidophosphoribosyltransferase